MGSLGALLSCFVYIYHEPYIENDDDVVSAVAQAQTILIYFAALAAYTAQEADQKRAAFSGVGFGVVLILTFFASFIVGIYVVLVDTFGRPRLLRARRRVSGGLLRVRSSRAFNLRDGSVANASYRGPGPNPSIVHQQTDDPLVAGFLQVTSRTSAAPLRASGSEPSNHDDEIAVHLV